MRGTDGELRLNSRVAFSYKLRRIENLVLADQQRQIYHLFTIIGYSLEELQDYWDEWREGVKRIIAIGTTWRERERERERVCVCVWERENER